MSELEPGYSPESEQGVEFNEAEAWAALSEIARRLF